uniref:Uncharacterized protein n=1 Tax=Micrurus lemniscatus lemniscatus TaxID=129467 RepID=A0A2D4IUI5_MICLE
METFDRLKKSWVGESSVICTCLERKQVCVCLFASVSTSLEFVQFGGLVNRKSYFLTFFLFCFSFQYKNSIKLQCLLFNSVFSSVSNLIALTLELVELFPSNLHLFLQFQFPIYLFELLVQVNYHDWGENWFSQVQKCLVFNSQGIF